MVKGLFPRTDVACRLPPKTPHRPAPVRSDQILTVSRMAHACVVMIVPIGISGRSEKRQPRDVPMRTLPGLSVASPRLPYAIERTFDMIEARWTT